ncbi:response regulator transcription factor [candidate division KSB1 bacterium]|nr:response regulator transcription factor [candidate division KSB1 bacterium]
MYSKIKVLLASRPKLLSEVIRYLVSRQPDMEVVSEVLDPLELLLAVKVTNADVVIVTPLPANGEPHICTQLLAAYAQLKIVTQSAKGEAAYLYQSGTPKQRIDEPSAELILGVIRESLHDHKQTKGDGSQ